VTAMQNQKISGYLRQEREVNRGKFRKSLGDGEEKENTGHRVEKKSGKVRCLTKGAPDLTMRECREGSGWIRLGGTVGELTSKGEKKRGGEN